MPTKKKRSKPDFSKEHVPRRPPEKLRHGLTMPTKFRVGPKIKDKARRWSAEFKDYSIEWLDKHMEAVGTHGAFRAFVTCHGLPDSTGGYFNAYWNKTKGVGKKASRGGSKNPAHELIKLAELVETRVAAEKVVASIKREEELLRARCRAYLDPE